MKSTTIFLVFGSVIGTQASLRGRGVNNCQLESKIITQLKSSYAQAASTYCSSFIAKSTTVTISTTPVVSTTTTPVSTVTTTPTTTAIVGTDTTITSTMTTTTTTTIPSGTTTVTASCTPPAAKAKRDEILKSANGKKFNLINGTPEKRTAPPTPSCPAPLKYLAAQVVSSICSCIVTPTTKTSTVVQTFPAVTSTSTAPTSTKTITAPVVLVTSTTTNTVVTTTTTTITSTTTTPAATATVAPLAVGGGSCGCSYTANCGTQYVDNGDGTYVTQASSLQQCIQQCDENFNCAEYSFQYSTGVCTQLHDGYNVVANADFASGAVARGTCGGICATIN